MSTTMSSDAAAVLARVRKMIGQGYTPDQCLKFVRSAWGAAGMGGTAAQSWARTGAQFKHSDSQPPIGAPVWFTGGSSGAGHVAIVTGYRNGEPIVATTDYPKLGSIGEVPLSELQSAWSNLHYVGWSTQINNKQILKGQQIPAGDGGASVATQSGSAPATSASVQQYLEENFGLTSAVIAMDKTKHADGKSLQWAWNQIVNQKITDPGRAANILSQTDWFKTYGVKITQNLAQEKSAPGVFAKQVDSVYAQLKDRAVAMGMDLTKVDLHSIARQAYVYGLNDSQVTDRLMKSGATYSGGGTTASALQQLDQIAYANGVTVSDKDKTIWGNQIIAGDKTPQDFEKMLRERSAQTYSVFGDQIRKGQNLSDLTSAYRDKAASLLEVDPNNIKWDDPLFKDGKAFTTTDPKTGQPAVKNLWDFQKDIQADSRWQYTQNAHDTYMNTANGVLKRFGMVA